MKKTPFYSMLWFEKNETFLKVFSRFVNLLYFSLQLQV
jgi:hypothetical protein